MFIGQKFMGDIFKDNEMAKGGIRKEMQKQPPEISPSYGNPRCLLQPEMPPPMPAKINADFLVEGRG